MNGTADDWQRLLGERAWLGSLARQLVRADEVADEAAHEALAAAWVSKVPPGLSPRRWLAAILGKQLAGRRRAQHRRTAREQLVASPESAPPAADVVARFEVQRAVADAVIALPEPYRTTVLRRFFEDEPPATIAAAMAVPVETVRTRLKRGLQMLRERLDAAHRGDRRAWALPLWFVGRTDSVAMGLLLGVSLMTAMQKLVAAAVAVGVAVLLWTTAWAPPATPPGTVARAEGTPASVVAASPLAVDALPAAERTEAATAGAATAADPEPKLVVTGLVVDDETGEPLPGIAVKLVSWPRDEASEPTSVCDANGAFTLHGARRPDEPLEVFVHSTEHAFAHAPVTIAAPPDASGAARGDAGTLRLVRGTWFSGHVVDADGRGVAGAQLLLPLVANYLGGPNAQHMLERSAMLGRSDAAGAFRLQRAIGPAVSHGDLLFAVAPQGIGWCRVQPGRQRREVTDLVVALRRNGALRVTVRDPAGAVAAGVRVRALPRFGPLGIENRAMREQPSGLEEVAARFRGTTDGKGDVLFAALPIGEAGVHRLGRTHERAYDVWLEAEGFPRQALLPCELQPDAEVQIAARLVAARDVTVIVTVHDDAGAPVAGARVDVGGERAAGVNSDATGRAELVVAALPRISVSATAAGHGSATRWFDVGPDVHALDVRLTLPRMQPLEGVVVDQRGEPAAGMWLVFEGQDSVARTDAVGRFRIDAFPVGEHRLTVALAPKMDRTLWTGEQAPELVDAARGPVTIVMQRRPGRVDVRVAIVDARSGHPLEPTKVALRLHDAAQDRHLLQKDVQLGLGRITAAATPAGRWRLDVVTASGHRGSLAFQLDEVQTVADLRLELAAPGTLTGRVQFVGVPLCERVTLTVRHATPDRDAYNQYRYAGQWVVDAQSQTIAGEALFGTGTLILQPARNPTFRLDRVDPDQPLVLRATGDGAAGEATVRVGPGGTVDVVVAVRQKAR